MRGNRLFKFLDRCIGIPICFILGLFDKIFHQKSAVCRLPSAILVIKLSAMGDTLLLVPSLRALRRAYPDSKIGIIVTSINREVIKDCPYIDEVIFLDIKGCLKNLFGFVRFIQELKKREFDLALDFDQWLRVSPIIAYFSGAKERIGFKTDGQYRDCLYTTKVNHARGRHEVECFLDIIRTLGIEPKDKSIEFWIRDGGDLKTIYQEGALIKEDLLIAIHPGCGTHGHPREWPKKSYVRLADVLIDEYGAKVILTGGKDEVGLCQEIAGLMKNRPAIVAGKASLSILASLLRECSLFISGNCGIMHLATAVRTPVVALHGPTDPSKWGPWGEGHIVIRKDLSCSPCLYLGFEYGCKNRTCMDLISVEDVLSAIRQKIQSKIADQKKQKYLASVN